MELEIFVWKFKSISKSISWIDSSFQNMSIPRNKDNWFFRNCYKWITYPLIRLSITLISTPTAALLIVDISRALTIFSTASRKFLPSESCSVPSSWSPVNWDTRVWQRGIRRDRACLEWVHSENRDCGRTEALEAERAESLEGGRCVALDPGRDVFCEGGCTDRLEEGRLDGDIE